MQEGNFRGPVVSLVHKTECEPDGIENI